MNSISTTFDIDAAEPVFAGHFPGFPILPGVMLLALLRRAVAQETGKRVAVKAIARQRFARPVLPGMQVRVEADISQGETGWITKCRWTDASGNQQLGRADLTLELQ